MIERGWGNDNRDLATSSMDWQPRYETVIQVSRRELDLFTSRDKAGVFDKYRHPRPRGIVRNRNQSHLAPLDVSARAERNSHDHVCSRSRSPGTWSVQRIHANERNANINGGHVETRFAKSSLGSGRAPKAITLTILKDTPELTSWRMDIVEAKGESMSFSWSGPLDGSLQPLKDPKGQVLVQEALTRTRTARSSTRRG